MTHLFDPAAPFVLPIVGEDATYPVNRIFCIGRNYAAHAAEMGAVVDREAPFYFTKSPLHAVHTGATLPYPPGTNDYHHEMELSFAIANPVFRATREEAEAAVFGYACSLDMTRRDLQAMSKEKRRPWDTSKDVEGSGVFGPLTRVAAIPSLKGRRMQMQVNGETRQDTLLDDMIQDVTNVIMHLSTLYHLTLGDVIMTGTPAGVSAVQPGDVIDGQIDGLEPVKLTLSDPE